MHKALLLCVMLGMVTAGKAQQRFSFERKVRLGFKIDPAVVALKPQDAGVERNAARAGASYGIMADFLLDESGSYAIASGLQVSTGGSKLKYEAGKGLDAYSAQPAE